MEIKGVGLEDVVAHVRAMEAELDRRASGKFRRYFLDTGLYRRALYPKHIDFFRAGAVHRERAFIAANRVGKSDAGSFELSAHLTGQYPDWWEGRRFTEPIRAWACGDTSRTVRDIIQEKLVGGPGAYGTGMIPAETLIHRTSKPGIPDAIESVWVRHASGGTSVLGLKTYAEGRESFQGTAQNCVWMDEEPDEGIYTEALLRTMSCDGIVFCTLTPLRGLSPFILSFMPGGVMSEGTVQAATP
tara:strand:- start:698 stop:1429 length:732 start_codon:yes stop_codon:yes gene_type:complete